MLVVDDVFGRIRIGEADADWLVHEYHVVALVPAVLAHTQRQIVVDLERAVLCALASRVEVCSTGAQGGTYVSAPQMRTWFRQMRAEHLCHVRQRRNSCWDPCVDCVYTCRSVP